jgi:cyanophycinase
MAASAAQPGDVMPQWLWREAGGYGARMVFITAEAAHASTLDVLASQMTRLECDQVAQMVILNRNEARNEAHAASVAQATAIVLVGDEPERWTVTLGGTPLAQAIRRANARSKIVAGIGAVSSFLCQHVIAPGHDRTTLRGATTFAPGLGLINRLVVDAVARASDPHGKESGKEGDERTTRLLASVAANPFLIGVGIDAGGAVILYSDNTLQASGPNTIAVVDGQQVEAVELDAGVEGIVGARHYTLHTGEGYNLDDYSFRPAGEIDLPPTGPVTSVF